KRKDGDRWSVRIRKILLGFGFLLFAFVGGQACRSLKSVTAARHGDEIAQPVLALVEGLSQCRNVNLDVAFIDHEPGPYPFHDLAVGQDTGLWCGQQTQYVDCPAPEWHDGSLTQQLASPEVEPKGAEPNLIAAHRSSP